MMRTYFSLLVLFHLFFTVPISKAQTAGAIMATAEVRGKETSEGKYTVQGRVINSLTGEALPQVLIKADNYTAEGIYKVETALTGPSGEYEFHDLSSQRTSISSEKDCWRHRPAVDHESQALEFHQPALLRLLVARRCRRNHAQPRPGAQSFGLSCELSSVFSQRRLNRFLRAHS